MSEYEPIQITLPPGIVKGQSGVAARDRWIDCNLVRFWKDFAERWAGWQQYVVTPLGNPARGATAWVSLNGTPCMAWGTADKLWLWRGGSLFDITPTDIDYVEGFVDTQAAIGWGEGGWGEGGWGGGFPIGIANGGRARTWMLQPWGEDLLANPRGGKIYHWAFDSGTPSPAEPIDEAPESCVGFFVTDDRHLVALGASVGSDPSPLRIAWANRETLDEWTPLPDNTAGDMLLESGNEIIGWSRVRSGYIVITDTSNHNFNLVGGNDVFGVDRKGSNAGLIAPHAVVESDGIAIWMGEDGFYSYEGVITAIPCDVHDYVFKDINRRQTFKVCAGTNTAYAEAIWFYPSEDSTENDRYVSIGRNGWMTGELARTSWLDQSAVVRSPIAVTPEGVVIRHDIGTVDENGDPIPYRLSSGDVALKLAAVTAGSENYTRIRGVVPDYERLSGDHTLTIEARRRPMDSHVMTKGPYTFDSTTGKFSAKARGRSFRLLFEGSGDFRMGQSIAYGRPDGGR